MDPPLEWIDFTAYDDPAVEAIEKWVGSLPEFTREHELGKLDDLLDAASRGVLEDTGDERTPIEPIRRDPEIYELRHKVLAKKLRLYHGEPPELPDALVALHRHIKVDKPDQDAQIERAVDRYNQGRALLWESA